MSAVAAARDALECRRLFKLICGASFRNRDVVRWLSQVFTHAGAHLIDVGPQPELVEAARAGIRQAQTEGAPGEPVVMVSLEVNADQHFTRIQVDRDQCVDCSLCVEYCPHGVFSFSDHLEARLDNCIGCRACLPACYYDALRMVPRDDQLALQDLLTGCWEAGARALELHTGDGNWAPIADLYGLIEREKWPLLSFSIGNYAGQEGRVSQMAQAVHALAGSGIILQIDGKPISGREGEESTIPSLELAREISPLGLPVYLQVAGGANRHSGRLAKAMDIPIHGVGMGSFAKAYLGVHTVDSPTSLDLTRSIQRARELVISVEGK